MGQAGACIPTHCTEVESAEGRLTGLNACGTVDPRRCNWAAAFKRRGNVASTAALGGSLQDDSARVAGPPMITLPKGGGAIRGIGEKFAANPVTGTGSHDGADRRRVPGRAGFRPAARALLRLRRRQRPVRLRLELSLAGDHPQDRQGPAALPRRARSRTSSSSPARRTSCRCSSSAADGWTARSCDTIATAGGLRVAALPAAHRGPVRPHRALDARRRPARRPLALDHPRQRHDALRHGRREPHRRSRPTPRASSAG